MLSVIVLLPLFNDESLSRNGNVLGLRRLGYGITTIKTSVVCEML